ncbi:MAG: hypothetical protein K2H53_00725 [Clostridia bacterium]|nr:hypothetical protein [Clostridia bacterium]
MNKIAEYDIIRGSFRDSKESNEKEAILNFVNRVNKAISEGWQPIGGMAVDRRVNCSATYLYQTIVRNKIEE